MAYNPSGLSKVYGTFDGLHNVWMYTTLDPIATVNNAGYIANASDMGMKVRDIVWVMDLNAPTTNLCSVIAITAGAADLSDGTPISETNTD